MLTITKGTRTTMNPIRIYNCSLTMVLSMFSLFEHFKVNPTFVITTIARLNYVFCKYVYVSGVVLWW